MDIDTLKHFHYIATYKNITKAAEKFYISQSTLSRQMMALEDELKVTLFIRDNRKFELTEAGKVFLNECSLLITHIESVIIKTQDTWNGINGSLRVVSPGNLTDNFRLSIKSFNKCHPKANLHLETYNFNEIQNAISHDLYDIGFTYDFATFENEDLEFVEIGQDDFSIIVSSDFIKNHKDDPIPYILKNLPLVLPTYTEPPFIKLMLYELSKIPSSSNKEIRYVNSTDSAMLQTAVGLAYSIVPTALTKEKINSMEVTIIPLDEFKTLGKVKMIYKKNTCSNLAKSFIEIVKSFCN